MKYSQSGRISYLEQQVLQLWTALNKTTDHLIETRQALIDLLAWRDQINSRMSSSSADTMSGPGDITPTSGATITDDINSAIRAGSNNPSKETRSDA
jgi:deoxyribodipyrimidine photolyase